VLDQNETSTLGLFQGMFDGFWTVFASIST
jgi:hypothetical protein